MAAVTPTSDQRPGLHRGSLALRASRFFWPLLQMVIAMKVGMMIYHLQLDTVQFCGDELRVSGVWPLNDGRVDGARDARFHALLPRSPTVSDIHDPLDL